MKSKQHLEIKLVDVQKKYPELAPFLEFLIEFLYKWFLTPSGERKPIWRALLVALYGEFWKDLFGLKQRLDTMVDKL